MGLQSRLRSDLLQAWMALRLLPFFVRFRPGAGWSPARLLEENAARLPDRPALRFLDETQTWRELDATVNRWANHLASRGVVAGDVVALLMDNRPEYVAALLATNKLGAVCACVNTHATGGALIHAVQVAGARLLIVGSEHEAAVRDVEATLALKDGIVVHADRGAPEGVQTINGAIAAASAERPRGPAPRTDAMQAYLYTSGTTGLPKAAKVTNRRFLLAAVGFGEFMHEATEQDVVYDALPLYHGTAQWGGLGAALHTGAALALRRKFSASQFWEDVRYYGATHVLYMGEVCRYLVNQLPRPDDRDHRVRVACGAGLRKDVWPTFQERFGIAHIREFYGATEGNALMVNLEDRVGMIGRLNIGQVLVACDPETGEPLRNARGFMTRVDRPGTPGLLLGRITRVATFDGYVDEQATETKILRGVFARGDAYFNTGDLMTLEEDGWVSFADRVGDTFRWKSENVSTSEVEEILNGAEGVLESNVYGVKVPGAEGRVGMASLNVSDVFDTNTFAAYVIEHLASYQRPYFVRVQREMQVTGTFKHRKVDYRAAGYDPAKVSDPLYFLEGDRYVPIDAGLYEKLRSGEVAPR